MKDAKVLNISDVEFKKLVGLVFDKLASCYTLDDIVYFGVKGDLLRNNVIPFQGPIILLTENYSGSIFVESGRVITITVHSV
jgi:hypothetical protein